MSMYGKDPHETADVLDAHAEWNAANLMREMAARIADLEKQLDDQTAATRPRLLNCGLCYEENSEEVHPHPECQITTVDRAAVLNPALEAQAAGDALTEFAEMLSARIPEGADTEVYEDIIGVILALREEANQKKIQADFLRSTAGKAPEDSSPDTLPAWLQQRFDPRGPDWDKLDDDDRAYWEHQARAVRRAVARNGFKET